MLYGLHIGFLRDASEQRTSEIIGEDFMEMIHSEFRLAGRGEENSISL